MVARYATAEDDMTSTEKFILHENGYAAEFEVATKDNASPWGPVVSKDDTFKADRIRLALRRGDIAAAAKEAKIYAVRLLAGE